nr:MAG TPA: hypothetical protein [Caudoviricetes sp.]
MRLDRLLRVSVSRGFNAPIKFLRRTNKVLSTATHPNHRAACISHLAITNRDTRTKTPRIV